MKTAEFTETRTLGTSLNVHLLLLLAGENTSCVVNILRNVIFFTPGVDGPLFAEPGGGRASYWKPRQYDDMKLDYNLYVDPTSSQGEGGVFTSAAAQVMPGNRSFKQWQIWGKDAHSAAAVNPSSGGVWSWEGFEKATDPQAQALGIRPLDIDDAGPDFKPCVFIN